ncbi:MAG: hypothetical protein E7321_09870 [Clostridiales bacterium]|nr:hypothetical protein [Clostridiales bacterium]
MGAWGTGISGNDTAMDLRSEYQAAFYYFDVNTALTKIDAYVRSKGLREEDEGEWCNYYYSLADYMWKKGILTESVKMQTLEMIDAGFGLDIWAETGKAALNERKKALGKFRERLCSEQLARKKIKIDLFMKPIFEPGDVVAFQLQTLDKAYLPDENPHNGMRVRFDRECFRSCHGKWIAMRKVCDDISYRSAIVPEVQDIWPCFQLYAALFDTCPTMEMLKDIPWTGHCPEPDLFFTEGKLSHFRKRNYRIIGSSLENMDIQDKTGINKDAIFFGTSNKGYNADTIILNAIME